MIYVRCFCGNETLRAVCDTSGANHNWSTVTNIFGVKSADFATPKLENTGVAAGFAARHQSASTHCADALSRSHPGSCIRRSSASTILHCAL
ncbi:hypothetical protein AVEN_72199-1 [Araneus ventricosus]|uniref:Uncharacterized protein n=1 Tax=Araneus ventricosus TaxID=182803 RepID=A0A4Y2S7V2_ARAVE|nr:hypothetical protein AVEN_72199-1 [Araneus ventricosus]